MPCSKRSIRRRSQPWQPPWNPSWHPFYVNTPGWIELTTWDGITEFAPLPMPVVVLGLSSAPNAGDELLAVESERKAREVALYRQGKFRDVKLARQTARQQRQTRT